MKLPVEELDQILFEGNSIATDGMVRYELVQDQQVAVGRWSEERELIFTDGTKYWGAIHYQGLTEQQEVDRWLAENDMVNCYQVWPEERTITVYTNKVQE